MTVRKPIVLVSGQLAELPSGDSIGDTSGGGDVMPVDTIVYLPSVEPIIVDEAGNTWLRSGYVEDNLATYPNATPFVYYDDTANDLDISHLGIAPSWLVYDGTYFWVAAYGGTTIYKLNSDGTGTGTTITASVAIHGLTFNGTDLAYCTNSVTDSIYTVDRDTGVNTRLAYINGNVTTAVSIAWNPTNSTYAVLDNASLTTLRIFDSSGTYIETIQHSSASSGYGLGFSSSGVLYYHDISNYYHLRMQVPVGNESAQYYTLTSAYVRDISEFGDHIAAVDFSDKRIHVLKQVIGLPEYLEDADTGHAAYIRVN